MTYANDMIDTGQRKITGGQTMSFIHNRMGAVTLAVAATVLLLGAGCQKAKPSAPAATAPSSDAQATADATANLPTEWAEYRSEKLGITIPYPEGWYVEERETGARFHEAPPPATEETEYPAVLWVDVFSGSVDEFLTQFRSGDILEQNDIVKSGRSMRRVALRHDVLGRTVSYLWTNGASTLRIGGRDDSVLEYAVNNLEAQK